MDHQRRTIESQTEQLKNFEVLRRDRARAQLVMDAQANNSSSGRAMPISWKRNE